VKTSALKIDDFSLVTDIWICYNPSKGSRFGRDNDRSQRQKTAVCYSKERKKEMGRETRIWDWFITLLN